MGTRYSLTELAKVADVTPRTVRYYIAQGLLPGPEGQGPAASYDKGHLGRLRLIKQLQAEHLPLAEIRGRLEQLDDQDVAALESELAVGRSIDEPLGATTEPDAGADALDYIRGVLGTGPAPSPARAVMAFSDAMEATPSFATAPAHQQRLRERLARYGPKPPGKPRPPGTERTSWERISLAPDIELHVRRPLGRQSNRQLERLLQAAREVFSED